jgi:ubiquinone/menaquinone biosynthesis C-methylase UbiE
MANRKSATPTKSSSKTDQFFWRENFEVFSQDQVERYHAGVTGNPFNECLYDPLLIKLIEPHVGGGTSLSILDAGGGTGKWAVHFARLGHRVTLLDVAQPMLAKAEQVIEAAGLKDVITIRQGSIAELPYRDDSFDVVFSDRNPISHVGRRPQSYRAIRELVRVLRPGGAFIASVLNKHRKIAQLVSELDLDRAKAFMATGELRRGDDDYSYYFSENELRECLGAAGLEVQLVHGTTVFAEWIPTAWLLNAEVATKLRELEELARTDGELSRYGVRLHVVGKKR